MAKSNIILLSKEEIAAVAPAALKKEITQEEKTNLDLSDRYEFFSTDQLIKDLGKMGWGVKQVRKPRLHEKNAHKIDVSRHLLRFQNPKLMRDDAVGSIIPEIYITNSHDGTQVLKVHAGLYRKVCSNGLCVMDEELESFKMRHDTRYFSFEDVRNQVNQVAKSIPKTLKVIDRWRRKKLDEQTQHEFAARALALRIPKVSLDGGRKLNKAELKNFNLEELLVAKRPEDEGNSVWKVYNRIQEHLIKGEFKNYGADVKRGGRGQRNMNLEDNVNAKGEDQAVDVRRYLLVNKALWSLADSYSRS